MFLAAATVVGTPAGPATAAVAHVHAQSDPTVVGAQAPAAARTFLETFDGAPASPLAFSNPNSWDIFPSGLDPRQNGTDAQRAHHGPNCGAPGFPYTTTNTHPISSERDMVFICNNHLMTSTGLTGYGAVYMVPPAMADLSGGTSRIEFEMSTLRTASRDWVYFTLMPFHGHNKFAYNSNDQAIPPYNINVSLAGINAFTVTERSGDGTDTKIASDGFTTWDMVQEANGVAPDAARRDIFQIDVSRTHLKVCIVGTSAGQRYTYRGENGFCWIDSDLPAPLSPGVWNDQAVFMMTHVGYNPEKSCSSEEDQFFVVHNPTGDANCPPNTWHWDNVRIDPAVPFTIVNPLQPFASFTDPSGANTVAFAAPAPANAFLSYVAEGDCAQQRFSVNGGASWIAAVPQPTTTQCAHPENGGEYWTPIPAGTTAVKFSGTPTFGHWSAAGIAIWAGGGSLPPISLPPVGGPPVTPVPPSPPSPPRPSSPQPPVARVPSTLDFHSAWVDQSAYPTVAPGGTASITLRFRNTGTDTWQSGVPGRQVNLGVSEDSTRFSDLAVDWLSANRVATHAEATVAPGQVGTFTFTVRAPAPGSYRIPLRLVADGVSWLDDQGVYVVVKVTDAGLHSTWVWQSAGPVLRPGTVSEPLTFLFRNTGASTWQRGSGGELFLGVVGDDKSWGPLGVGWPAADRPASQAEPSVGPGALTTFEFRVRAPAEPGTYVLLLRPLIEGVTWLEDDGVYIVITVVP